MKKLFLSVLGLAFAVSMNAETTISIEGATFTKGETVEMPIYLTNSGQVDAMVLEINLPEGLEFVLKTSGRATYTKDTDRMGEGSWSDAASSTTVSKCKLTYTDATGEGGFVGNSGQILSFSIKVAADFKGGVIAFGNSSAAFDGADCPDFATKNYTAAVIGETGVATFSSASDVKVAGAKAYYGTVSGNFFTCTEIADGIVPANTGVILMGTAGTAVSLTTATASPAGSNDLMAAVEATPVTGQYALGAKSGKAVLGTFTGTVPAGKAYLPASKAPAGAPLRVVIDATGLDAIESAAAVESYDLFGNKAQGNNGQVSIENGKKVIRR